MSLTKENESSLDSLCGTELPGIGTIIKTPEDSALSEQYPYSLKYPCKNKCKKEDCSQFHYKPIKFICGTAPKPSATGSEARAPSLSELNISDVVLAGKYQICIPNPELRDSTYE